MSKKIPQTSTVGLSKKDCILFMDSSWAMHESPGRRKKFIMQNVVEE